MVGLNGVVVKSHGGTDAKGFAHAVDVAMDMVVHRFNDLISVRASARLVDRAGAWRRWQNELQPAHRRSEPVARSNGERVVG